MLDKTAKTVFHGFIESVKESKRHPNKQCVGQRRAIYNNLTQNWWDDNDILMSLTYNKSKRIYSEMFIKALKSKIHKKLIANDSKFYLSYFIRKILIIILSVKKPLDADYSTLTKIMKSIYKALKFKVGHRVRITNVSRQDDDSFQRIWLHWLKKSLMENFIFLCSV